MYCNVIHIQILLAQELNLGNGKSCGFTLVGPHFCNLICVQRDKTSAHSDFCLRHILHNCFLWDWVVLVLLPEAESEDGSAQIGVSPGACALVAHRTPKNQHNFQRKTWPYGFL